MRYGKTTSLLAALALSACSMSGGPEDTFGYNDIARPVPNPSDNVNAGLTAQQARDKQLIAENTPSFHFSTPTTDNIMDEEWNVIGMSKLKSLTLAVNGKTYQLDMPKQQERWVYLSPKLEDFKKGHGVYPYTLERTMDNKDGETQKGRYKLYNQPYSFISGKFLDWKKTLSNNGTSSWATEDGGAEHENEIYYGHGGIDPGKLPQNTKYTYVGKAFDAESEGDLHYDITFNTDNTGYGSGRITGMATRGDIELKRGDIGVNGNAAGISGEAVGSKGGESGGPSNGTYDLGIYGPDAAEIAGIVTFDNPTEDRLDDKVGFGGAKK
ncbi:MAG: factor H binding family protein [Neisseria sp.]|nr:factor H binding family protein [Neisseria sp.]